MNPYKNSTQTYLHGYDHEEQQRLLNQARLLEQTIYSTVDFSMCRNVLEIGCGVGAQSEILLRRFPNINLSSIDFMNEQIRAAKKHIEDFKIFNSRWNIQQMDAEHLQYEDQSFDGVFICWMLEHTKNPLLVLNEAFRVLKPGGLIVVNEVMNFTFFLDPYSPKIWQYWMAFNDYQYDQSGDPFVGVKLGQFLKKCRFNDIKTNVKTLHLDDRQPQLRASILTEWLDLLESAAPRLIESNYINEPLFNEMQSEFKEVKENKNPVFFYSFMQAFGTK